MSHLLTGRTQAQRGGALVEFAVIAPVLFLFLIGSIEFGLAIYEVQATNFAARAGARWAAVHGADCKNTSVCPTAADGSAVTTYVKGAIPGLETNAASFSVATSWATPDPSTYARNNAGKMTCDSSDQNQGCLVKVIVTNPLTIALPMISQFHYTLTDSSTVPVQ